MVELLRLCVVVFFAGIGYYVADAVDEGGEPVLGAFSVLGLGVILGSALGYVLGGVIGRGTVTAVRAAEAGLRDTPAEQIVAGVVGAVIGVLVAAGVTWPVLLLNKPVLTFPLFAFVVVTFGLLGYRLGDEQARLGAGHVRRPGRHGGAAGRVGGDAARARHLGGDRRPDRRRRPGRLPARPDAGADPGAGRAAGAGGRRRTTPAGPRAAAGSRCSTCCAASPASTSRCSTTRCPDVPEVDAKLVRICLDHDAALLTLDTNLARAASLAGVRVMNLHALALALRPPVSAGDEVSVLLIKPGKEPGQAVGYLDDGTMVVVEHARGSIGRELRSG